MPTPVALFTTPAAATPWADAPTARWLTQLWRLSRATVLLLPGGADPDQWLRQAALPLTARRGGDQPLGVGPGAGHDRGPGKGPPGPMGPRPPEVTLVWTGGDAVAPEEMLRQPLPGECALADPGARTLAWRLQRWHAQCGGRLMVAVCGTPGWLAGGPALGGFDPETAAWLALLRHPQLPVHTLLALDEDFEPWLDRWAAHWPGLTEQTLRLSLPSRWPTGTSAGIGVGAASAPGDGAASTPAALPARAAADSTAGVARHRPSRRTLLAGGAASLALAGCGVWWSVRPGRVAPAFLPRHPPATPAPQALAPAGPPTPASQVAGLVQAAGLRLVFTLAGLAPDSVAWVGYDALATAWRGRQPALQILMPWALEPIRFLVPTQSPLQQLHQARGLAMSSDDRRALESGRSLWRLAFGVEAPAASAGSAAVRVALGDQPLPGWRALTLDARHAGTARMQRWLLPGADSSASLLSYLVVGAGRQAPDAARVAALATAWCRAGPAATPPPRLPTPWPEHPAAADVFERCAVVRAAALVSPR